MHKLPPLPDTFRVLHQEESDRLADRYPSLPKSLKECPTCDGQKSFQWYRDYDKDDLTIVDWECPCQDQFIMFKYFLNAGMGKPLQRLMWHDAVMIDQSALDQVRDYLENSTYYANRGMGFLFHGKHGNGKTMLATLMLKELLAAGHEGYFTQFTHLLDNFAAGWRNDEHKVWFERQVRNVPILVVDDIGKENRNLNNMASQALDNIFRSRVQSGLPTLATTNLSLAELEKAYSTGVMSLLSETSFNHEFNGPDWRPKQRERTLHEVRNFLTRPIVVGGF